MTKMINGGRWLIAAIIFTCMSGCGAIKAINAQSDMHSKMEGHSGKNDVTRPSPSRDEFLLDMSRKYGLMSLFALTVYRYDLDDTRRAKDGCNLLKRKPEIDGRYGMPNSGVVQWARWEPESSDLGDEPPCVNDDSGLFYETYVRRADNKIVEFVIAYRGTENKKGQWATDWKSNLANLFGFEPSSYERARKSLPELVKRMRHNNPGVPIYVVGHSLGGGLAQQAGYLSKDVTAVFTFNTSPVTNWSNLRLLGLVNKGYPTIYRISNGGEALAGIRAIATAGTTTRYGRHDIQIQFGEKEILDGHDIGRLACNFAKILSDTKTEDAAHGYPLSFIESHVIRVEGQLEGVKRVCDGLASE